VRQVADVFGPGSTARSMRKVAERALDHDDEEVRRLANQLLAELDRSAVTRRRPLIGSPTPAMVKRTARRAPLLVMSTPAGGRSSTRPSAQHAHSTNPEPWEVRRVTPAAPCLRRAHTCHGQGGRRVERLARAGRKARRVVLNAIIRSTAPPDNPAMPRGLDARPGGVSTRRTPERALLESRPAIPNVTSHGDRNKGGRLDNAEVDEHQPLPLHETVDETRQLQCAAPGGHVFSTAPAPATIKRTTRRASSSLDEVEGLARGPHDHHPLNTPTRQPPHDARVTGVWRAR
jgi:hypothetical protein